MSSHQVNRTNVERLRGLLAGALGAVFLAALSGSGPVWSAPPAPVEYADLYAGLDAKLKAIDGVVTARSTGGKHDVTFSAELLPANANIREPLFPKQTLSALSPRAGRGWGGGGGGGGGKAPGGSPPPPRGGGPGGEGGHTRGCFYPAT